MIPEEIKDYYDILLLQTPRRIMGSDRNIKEFYNHPQEIPFYNTECKACRELHDDYFKKNPHKNGYVLCESCVEKHWHGKKNM